MLLLNSSNNKRNTVYSFDLERGKVVQEFTTDGNQNRVDVLFIWIFYIELLFFYYLGQWYYS
jgi:hypothetical protein